MRIQHLLTTAALITAGTAFHPAAQAAQADSASNAQQTPGESSEARTSGATSNDIIVTARRRAENLQRVPVAISAFSQDTLREQAITSANDLNKAVPGLTVAAGSGNPGLPSFAIRGRGQNFGAAAGSVETYFADVPLSPPFQSPTLQPQFFDLQSFQVLKGPQGTLFGRSTTGGAVLIVPHGADPDFGGYGRVQVGNYDNIQAEGAINVPLGDIAALRVAGFYWKRDGYTRTVAGTTETLTGQILPSQRMNDRDQLMLRGTLQLDPSDSFSNTTIVTYSRVKDQFSAGAGLLLAPGPNGFTTVPAPGAGTYTSFSDVRFDNPARTALAVVNTSTLDLSDALTLKNIFGFITAKGSVSQGTNADGTAATTISLPTLPRKPRNKQYTNELQLQGNLLDDRLSFILGGLADITRQSSDPNKITLVSGTVRTPTCTAAGCTLAVTSRFAASDVDSYGLFGSATYNITPELGITGAYRHSWEKVSNTSGSASAVIPQAPGARTPSTPSSLTSAVTKFQGDTYNVGLDWQATDRTLVYGGYRRGFKRGGFNDSAVPPLPKTFGPEKIDDFYLGLKTSFDVGAIPVRFNAEGYYDIYKGQQVSYLSLAVISGVPNLVTVTTNVDKTEFKGFEFDLAADLAPWLTLSGNYALTDAKNVKWTDATVPGLTQDLSVNPVPYVSKHKLSATARLHSELDNDMGEFVFAPTVSYQSKFITYTNAVLLPYATQFALGGLYTGSNIPLNINGLAIGADQVNGYTLVDLRFEWNRIAASKFSLAANVTNLFDKLYYQGNSATITFGVEGAAYGPPQMFSLDLSYEF